MECVWISTQKREIEMKAIVLSDGHEMVMFPWQQNEGGGADMVTWEMTRTHVLHVSFSMYTCRVFVCLLNTSDHFKCNNACLTSKLHKSGQVFLWENRDVVLSCHCVVVKCAVLGDCYSAL